MSSVYFRDSLMKSKCLVLLAGIFIMKLGVGKEIVQEQVKIHEINDNYVLISDGSSFKLTDEKYLREKKTALFSYNAIRRGLVYFGLKIKAKKKDYIKQESVLTNNNCLFLESFHVDKIKLKGTYLFKGHIYLYVEDKLVKRIDLETINSFKNKNSEEFFFQFNTESLEDIKIVPEIYVHSDIIEEYDGYTMCASLIPLGNRYTKSYYVKMVGLIDVYKLLPGESPPVF